MNIPLERIQISVFNRNHRDLGLISFWLKIPLKWRCGVVKEIKTQVLSSRDFQKVAIKVGSRFDDYLYLSQKGRLFGEYVHTLGWGVIEWMISPVESQPENQDEKS